MTGSMSWRNVSTLLPCSLWLHLPLSKGNWICVPPSMCFLLLVSFFMCCVTLSFPIYSQKAFVWKLLNSTEYRVIYLQALSSFRFRLTLLLFMSSFSLPHFLNVFPIKETHTSILILLLSPKTKAQLSS